MCLKCHKSVTLHRAVIGSYSVLFGYIIETQPKRLTYQYNLETFLGIATS